jgi:hypothetical protein
MAGPTEGKPPSVPKPVEIFIVRLSAAAKSLRLYPENSELPRRSAAEVVEALREALHGEPSLILGVSREGLVYDGTVAFPKSESFRGFAQEFYKRNLSDVRFDSATTADDIIRFLSLAVKSAEEVASLGGFEAALWQLAVSNVAVTEAATRVVDANLPGSLPATASQPVAGESEEESKSVEEILREEGAAQTRDRRVLMRVLRDRRAVAAYLRGSRQQDGNGTGGPGGAGSTVKDLAERIATLAATTRDELPSEQAAVLGVIAEAIIDLQPSERGELYETSLLEEARRDEAIAQIINDLGVDEVVNSILAEIDETPEALGGLSRAVRNLALINVSSPKEEVLDLAVEKMRAKGLTEQFVSEFMEAVAPTHLTGADQQSSREFKPVETVLRLVDMTPDSSNVFVYDDAVEPLRNESIRGTTDGDVLAVLVTVARLETRDEEFSQVMGMLDESVGYLVDAEEADVAADVAEALNAAASDPGVTKEHRDRFGSTVQMIAKPDSIRKVTSALRRYKPDSPEYIACRRLIGVLGATMIDSLLEVLAEESDMAARKALVELISTNARGYIPELGARLGDRRWFLVRNVVAILGSTKSPEALNYLQRTLRHPDARVRRETIRGLAAIRVPSADTMLLSGLTDDDPQNVQMAARFLGSFGCRAAVPALLEAARGEGRGSRVPATRVQAIEALARINDPDSRPLLEDLARKRGFFGGGRDREIRDAAAAALQAMSSGQSSGVR